MPDEDAKECYDCGSRFTAWRRKHHCRVCGQIFCSTCASNLISGDRLWSSGYIRVCNICFARLDTDDDAMSEAAESEAPPHPLASSWTPSLASLRLLPSQTRKEPAEEPRPETRRTPRRRDYIIHERDLSGDLVSSWPVALGDAPSEPSPNLPPAPFRPAVAAVDDDQPAASRSPAPDSSAFDADDTRRRPSEPGEEQSAIVSASGPPQSTPVVGEGDVAHAGREAAAHALDDEEAVDAVSEDADSPTHPRARVISRPLLPRMASREAPEVFQSDSEAAARIPPPSTRKELPGNEAELTPAAFAHLRLMVRQALEREQVPSAEAWEDELLWLLAKVSRYPAPNVAAGEPSDVRRIVKIKTIPGGRPSDCEYVCGVVCTKNVLHKRMPRLIANPRVMLLDFSLDYERVEGRLTKLETLLTQEKTWLRSNVEKVLKVRPSVLLVQGNVPGYAIDLFVSAGVAVARNLRPELVQSIARVTQTSVNSMDKLAARPAYGHCGLFQVQTFAHSLIPGFKKTFLRFEGCPPELGATLVLRGADLAVLKRIKSIADIMVRAAYSLKLESYYLRDEGVFLGRGADETGAKGQNAAVVVRRQQAALQSVGQDEKTTDELSLAETVVAPYETLVFSSSPSVSIRPPIPLMELRSTLVALKELHHRRDDEEANRILREETGIKDATDPEKQGPTFALLSDSDVAFSASLAALDVRRRYQTQLANAFVAAHQADFDVAAHQKVVVQECVTRRSDGKLCRGHQLRELQFYHPGEPTIGQTIHALVASCSEPCPTKGCGETKQGHRTHYSNSDHEVVLWVHHQLKDPAHPDEIDVTLEPGNESLIIMESFCPVCEAFTLKTKMSDDSWRLSFGKFLELCFHSPGLYAKTMVRHDTGAHISCTHDAHLSHARHFFHRGYRVDILVRRTSVFDVHLPPTRLSSAPQTQLRLRNDEFITIEARTRLFFDSVRARLATLNPELAAIERQEKCRELLTTLGSNADADEKHILGKLEGAYESSAGTNGLLLNGIRKMLVDKAVSWDAEFTSLELAFLSPADKDVRRLTSMQIRKLFVDSGVSSSPERPTDSTPPSIAAAPDAAETEPDVPQSPLVRALQLADPSHVPLPDLPSASKAPDTDSAVAAGEKPGPASDARESTLHDNPSGASTPSISGDRDESAGSDSTVTGAEGRSTYHRFSRESGPDESPSTLSDTDPSSDHGLPVIAARSRRLRQPAGIAQLVQRFDGSEPSSPASATAPKANRTVSATSQRPGYRRGKSEGARILKRQVQREHGNLSDTPPADSVASGGALTASSSRDGSSTAAPSSRPMARPSKSTEGRSMPDVRRGTVKRTRSIGTAHRRGEAGESPEASERPGTLSRSGSTSTKPRALDLKNKDSVRRPRPENAQNTAAWSPARRPGLNLGGHSKVTAIARHFDRLTREAESDRARRATRGRRARPIAEAQSSVHAFSSVRAAMREDSDDEDDADDEEESGPSGAAIPEDAVGRSEPVSDLPGLSQSPKSSAEEAVFPTREDAPTEQAQLHSPVAAISRPDGLSSVPASPLLSSEGFAAASRMLNPLSESEVSSSDTTSRNSIMKTLSAFWSYRGADLIPLQYPQ